MELAETGRLLSGRYRLDAVIGRGGMGVVWRARDEMLGRDVAVKELVWPPHFTESEQQTACQRAVREAQIAGRLAHPNVVRIYDILEEDGHPWIIMELLPHQSLRDLVQEEGPFTPARAARIGIGVLAALRAAHAAGVLHRDVKPANILLAPEGRVVLTDFGIARATDSPTLTTAGALVGSPSYVAPERARGGQSSPAGDLWGLGASLYAAVEGHPPFEREDLLATLTAVVIDEPEDAAHAGPLWPVIRGLLRKDPAERLDAAETERMLHEVADDNEATRMVPDDQITRKIRLRLYRRPALALASLGALAVVTAAAIAAALTLTSSPGRPSASSGTRSHSAGRPASSPRASTPSASGTPSAAASGSGSSHGGSAGYGALPAGYYRFRNSTGFSIGVPDGWQISHAGHYVYINDPSNRGIFLLIDQSDTPKPNPLADWQQQAASRTGTYPDYHLIRLESVGYRQAEKAADWEFTYVRSGIPVHILNRNVLANAHHAYALYWSAPESDWNTSFHYFQALASTFQPAR
jgi:serine/threonine protein kinase